VKTWADANRPGHTALATDLEKNAFTGMIHGALEYGSEEAKSINQSLGIAKASEDIDGNVIVTSEQVDVMRQAEEDAAGGVALPFQLTPSSKAVVYYIHAHDDGEESQCAAVPSPPRVHTFFRKELRFVDQRLCHQPLRGPPQ
jgi:hypothetical protein